MPAIIAWPWADASVLAPSPPSSSFPQTASRPRRRRSGGRGRELFYQASYSAQEGPRNRSCAYCIYLIYTPYERRDPVLPLRADIAGRRRSALRADRGGGEARGGGGAGRSERVAALGAGAGGGPFGERDHGQARLRGAGAR